MMMMMMIIIINIRLLDIINAFLPIHIPRYSLV